MKKTSMMIKKQAMDKRKAAHQYAEAGLYFGGDNFD